jgi:hypothetical protein
VEPTEFNFDIDIIFRTKIMFDIVPAVDVTGYYRVLHWSHDNILFIDIDKKITDAMRRQIDVTAREFGARAYLIVETLCGAHVFIETENAIDFGTIAVEAQLKTISGFDESVLTWDEYCGDRRARITPYKVHSYTDLIPRDYVVFHPPKVLPQFMKYYFQFVMAAHAARDSDVLHVEHIKLAANLFD